MTPKEESELLLNALLPFALNQLKKRGGFYPFGAVLLNNDEISFTAVYEGEEHPDSAELINKLTEMHCEEAAQGKIKASGICWDAKVSLDNGTPSDAVIVSLEHKDSYTVIVGQPYRVGLFKKLHLGAMFAQSGKNDIFR